MLTPHDHIPAAATAPEPAVAPCAELGSVTRRILIVENNASTRRFLSTVLCDEGGCECALARDADEALALVTEAAAAGKPFDLILCDLMLPGIGGCALIAQLRQNGLRAPVLILSSQQTEESLAAALSAGADDYLQKPVDLTELRRSAGALLARSAEREASGAPPRPLNGASVALRTIDSSPYVELTAPTDSAQIDGFQRFAERLITPLMPHYDRINVRLALEEMVQNAREWGNGFDTSKLIRLGYCVLPDRVVFRIEDEGAGFEPYSVPDPSIDPREHIRSRLNSGKRLGGWGLFMTRKLMDEVTFNGRGNVVCITKLLKHSETTAVPEPDAASAGPGNSGSSETPECTGSGSKKQHAKTRRFINGELQWTK